MAMDVPLTLRITVPGTTGDVTPEQLADFVKGVLEDNIRHNTLFPEGTASVVRCHPLDRDRKPYDSR